MDQHDWARLGRVIRNRGDFPNAGAPSEHCRHCRGNQDPVTPADTVLIHKNHSGILPCFFAGRNTHLAARASNAAATQARVSAGSMMSSTSRAPAET
jgi:hypothetical protein